MESDPLVQREADRAAAQAGAIGGRAPDGDPAERPVREAGGGEAEGFEQAEQDLIDNASHGDLGHSPRNDAYPSEAESDRSDADYGEADQEQVPDSG